MDHYIPKQKEVKIILGDLLKACSPPDKLYANVDPQIGAALCTLLYNMECFIPKEYLAKTKVVVDSKFLEVLVETEKGELTKYIRIQTGDSNQFEVSADLWTRTPNQDELKSNIERMFGGYKLIFEE